MEAGTIFWMLFVLLSYIIPVIILVKLYQKYKEKWLWFYILAFILDGLTKYIEFMLFYIVSGILDVHLSLQFLLVYYVIRIPVAIAQVILFSLMIIAGAKLTVTKYFKIFAGLFAGFTLIIGYYFLYIAKTTGDMCIIQMIYNRYLIFIHVFMISVFVLVIRRLFFAEGKEQKVLVYGFAAMYFLSLIAGIYDLYRGDFVQVLAYKPLSVHITDFLAMLPILIFIIWYSRKYLGKNGNGKVDESHLKSLGFSNREVEIATLIKQGYSNKEISKKLKIAITTVERHIHNIYTKQDIKNRVELINLMNGNSIAS